MVTNNDDSKLKVYFHKIISGFFTGIGFSIAVLIFFSLEDYVDDSFSDSEKETNLQEEKIERPSLEKYFPSFVQFDEDSGLNIQSHKLIRNDDDVTVLGQIENIGKENWSNIHIEVEFFDSNKKFVDKCEDLIWGKLKAGQTRNFKVTCGECRNRPIVEFSSYEINVVDATHEKNIIG